MWNVYAKWIAALAILASLVGVEGAMATFDRQYQTKILSQKRAGPNPYHPTYANIQNTVVTIEDFFLRTADGQVVKVMTDYMTVDLQDLSKFGRGLLIDTRNVQFPPGVSVLDVVEIESRIVPNRPAYYNSADGSQCKLGLPKYLNFYTSAATPQGFQMGQDEYLVKVDFSPLNAIQINVITTTTQTMDCSGCFIFFRRTEKECEPVGAPKTRKVMTCELANSRHPINRIVRKVDEF